MWWEHSSCHHCDCLWLFIVKEWHLVCTNWAAFMVLSTTGGCSHCTALMHMLTVMCWRSTRTASGLCFSSLLLLSSTIIYPWWHTVKMIEPGLWVIVIFTFFNSYATECTLYNDNPRGSSRSITPGWKRTKNVRKVKWKRMPIMNTNAWGICVGIQNTTFYSANGSLLRHMNIKWAARI